MGYFNDVLVIFAKSHEFQGELDSREGGQMLPAGAIPLAVYNRNEKKFFLVTNGRETSELIAYLDPDKKELEEMEIIDF